MELVLKKSFLGIKEAAAVLLLWHFVLSLLGGNASVAVHILLLTHCLMLISHVTILIMKTMSSFVNIMFIMPLF